MDRNSDTPPMCGAVCPEYDKATCIKPHGHNVNGDLGHIAALGYHEETDEYEMIEWYGGPTDERPYQVFHLREAAGSWG